MHTLNYIHLLFWGGIFSNLYNSIQPKDSAKQAKKPPGVFVETGFPCGSLGGGLLQPLEVSLRSRCPE